MINILKGFYIYLATNICDGIVFSKMLSGTQGGISVCLEG